MAVLSVDKLSSYRRDGVVLLEQAFPRDLALRCRDLLWGQIDEAPGDRSTWTRPVVRVGSQKDPAFSEAAQSPRWVEAIIEVAGSNAAPTPWLGGTFAIRFPVDADPGDDGWHIEGSYHGPDGWWWTNYWSKGRTGVSSRSPGSPGRTTVASTVFGRTEPHRPVRQLRPH
jgi:hypothetical protein